ncbi:MAG TPA: sugar phosphate isomerase/epimerase family protein [Vicinamibacterales bacterium]|nr:sugar phosphate isomerase/epimerase [Acidobacteriota bacterium]HOC17891.1 sugar phosphate isomerase/epimerase family protein [Vicinamibacterales bacterium]
MSTHLSRRSFIVTGAAAAASLAAVRPSDLFAQAGKKPPFTISLAEWSLHRELQKKVLDNLDFAKVTRTVFDIDAIEYVNQFFKDKAEDAAYLAELNKRAKDHNVHQHLIMVDGEGQLGDPDEAARKKAVENHYRWVTAAKTLGCASIRVNAASKGTPEEQMKLAADGLRRLCEFAGQHQINVIVENHGGLSSHGDWLVGVMKLVNHPRCGTLPDFGNFYEYDRYKGVAELMEYAKGVSAKTHDFDAQGNETTKDYPRLIKIMLDAGYHSWVGIEYEGEKLPEREGIAASLRLLKKMQAQFA